MYEQKQGGFMLSNDAIQSETLAEVYIDYIESLKTSIEQGKIEECLLLLEQLEVSMQITLAMSERYSVVRLH